MSMTTAVNLREQYLWARSLANTQGCISSAESNVFGVLPAFRSKSKQGRGWAQQQSRHPMWKAMLQRGWVVRDIAGLGWRIAVGDGCVPPRTTPHDALDKPRQGADFNFSARVAKALAYASDYGRSGQIARAADVLRALAKPAGGAA
ncbi:MAG: hypothetical protein J6T92_04450 [Ottowia sp.]|nr:hypothetical protein [Ottowia sp.]